MADDSKPLAGYPADLPPLVCDDCDLIHSRCTCNPVRKNLHSGALLLPMINDLERIFVLPPWVKKDPANPDA